MIEDEQARVHTVWQWFKEMQRKKRKKKKKKKHRGDDDEDDDDMYHPSQDYNDDSQVDPQVQAHQRGAQGSQQGGRLVSKGSGKSHQVVHM